MDANSNLIVDLSYLPIHLKCHVKFHGNFRILIELNVPCEISDAAQFDLHLVVQQFCQTDFVWNVDCCIHNFEVLHPCLAYIHLVKMAFDAAVT